MKNKRKKLGRKRQQQKRLVKIVASLVALACVMIVAGVIFLLKNNTGEKQERHVAEQLLTTYMTHLKNREYDRMYQMIEVIGNSPKKDTFVSRNARIYEGIEMENLSVTDLQTKEEADGVVSVRYHMTFDTLAGEISFDNKAYFIKNEDNFLLRWEDGLIFPGLEASDKVRITTSDARRGQILDRNGKVLAGEGVASMVGVVPGKLQDTAAAVSQLSALLQMDENAIAGRISAEWVREDSFVPIKTIPKIKEIDLLTDTPDESVRAEKERQNQLLQIPGVKISDTQVREYPLAEAAAHLIGYVQKVTAEDLEEHAGEGYDANDMIGRSGLESMFEQRLRGRDGCEIFICDKNGETKQTLAQRAKMDGEDITLTIDSDLQVLLYQQFLEDKSCSVAMNPASGEMLALVSTPSFNDNDFIFGLTDEAWTALNEDERKPMYNRFRQVFCPGSSLKPLIGAIGLTSGEIEAETDYGAEGTSWQKDESWGNYFITTLHEAAPATLDNAIIYSDNIYFAKAALRIGAEKLVDALKKLGFAEQLPFVITVRESQYSNTEAIETEVQLADSGYGQGQILINPVHLASLYTAFYNGGDVVRPCLTAGEKKGEIWLEQAFSQEVSATILESLKKVISDPNGTGSGIFREDLVLAGKTGTAEIKVSKEDEQGTELGWFSVFTADPGYQNPFLIVTMVEDVKDRGGSAYVVNGVRAVLEQYVTQ